MSNWPWQGDSREERAKRIALSYRHLLYQVIAGDAGSDPATALECLDERWIGLGAGWVKPTDSPMRVDDWLTAADMGELLHQSPKAVYGWGRRGRIRVMMDNGVPLYNVGDVIEYARDRRNLRMRSEVS